MSALSLDEAKEHLNITGDGQDAELQATIAAAERVIAERCGPLEPTEVATSVQTRGVMSLSVTPVLSVTSIVGPLGAVHSVDGLDVDLDAGVLYSIPSGGSWPSGRYTVAYVAGREDVPEDLLFAVKEMLRHLWTTQRGSGQRPGQGQPGAQQAPGYLIPNRVAELIEPHLQIGFA